MGNDEIQGLKYINDSAKNFITSYNEEYSTNWISLEPDWRIIVHKCTVPFKVSWSFAPDYASPKEQEFLYIKITCEQTVPNIANKKHWDILVPTNRPDTDVY